MYKKDYKNNCYKINELDLPWISYGTGVIWKYTRNKIEFLKYNIRDILSTIKHLHWNRELYGNLYVNKLLNEAYNSGFRLFDSGRIYGYSEPKIGELNKKKNDILITTKCSVMDIENRGLKSVKENLQLSQKYLNVDKVDIYMLHWPEGNNWKKYYMDIVDTYKSGECRVYGICNLRFSALKELEDEGYPLPMIIQTEIHPYNAQIELKEYCKEKGILLMAHTPTGRGGQGLKNEKIFNELTSKYNKSVVQVILRWHYQNNTIPVVSCFDKKHMDENMNIFDFQLTEEEMIEINKLDKGVLYLDAKGIDDPKYIYNL